MVNSLRNFYLGLLELFGYVSIVQIVFLGARLNLTFRLKMKALLVRYLYAMF